MFCKFAGSLGTVLRVLKGTPSEQSNCVLELLRDSGVNASLILERVELLLDQASRDRDIGAERHEDIMGLLTSMSRDIKRNAGKREKKRCGG